MSRGTSKGVRVVAALEVLGGIASLVLITLGVLRAIPQVRAGVVPTRNVVLFFGTSAFIAALAVFFIAAGWRLWRGGPGAFRWSLWAQGISIPKLQLGYTMTIRTDGSYEGVSGRGRTFKGTMIVRDGKIRWKSQTTGATGTYTLHEGDGKRILAGSTDDGRISVKLTPAK